MVSNGKNSLVAKETGMVARDYQYFNWPNKNIALYQMPLTQLKLPLQTHIRGQKVHVIISQNLVQNNPKFRKML